MFGNTMDTRSAILFCAMCSQSYTQYEKGTQNVVLPAAYRVISSFRASTAFSDRELFGFIAESERSVVIVFRGTLTTSDWISDLIARQTEFPYAKEGGLVHQGFLDIYQTARKSIHAALSKVPSNKQLYITGHSLGGALASLCAVDLALNTKFSNPAVYTYGSPRVGNPAFASLFNRKAGPHYRVYNTNDMVPELPTLIYKSPRTDQLYHYNHVKKPIELDYSAGSFGANHAISGYFTELAKLDPKYADQLCRRTPGFCP